MTLKLNLVASFCLASSFALPAIAQDEEPPSPEKTAAHFIAALYRVKPEQVDVTLIKREALSATAVTHVKGLPNCTIDMAPTPEADPKFGWLIGGLGCDNSFSKDNG